MRDLTRPVVVSAVVADGVVGSFGLGVTTEVFGYDRTALGLPRFDYALVTERPGEIRTDTGLRLLVDEGLDRLERSDVVTLTAWELVEREPSAELVTGFERASGKKVGSEAKAIGQIPICWDPDAERAKERAHEQFRWFAGGWAVNADLPTTAGFAGATQFVRPEDVAEQIPCGPDLDAIVEAVRPYVEAGFTDVALIQVGDDTLDDFLATAARPLLEKLRAQL